MYECLVCFMSFHPEDKFREASKEVQKAYDHELKYMEQKREKLNGLFEPFRVPLQEANVLDWLMKSVEELLDAVFDTLHNMGKNRVITKKEILTIYEWLDMQNREIDRLSEKMAGLDKER